ncbi:VirB3 family type IV secretion system protein, partial [Campylobacter fetus]
MNEELKTADLYSALNKPNLIFGADRELILSVGVVAFALIFTGLNLISTIIGISLLVF